MKTYLLPFLLLLLASFDIFAQNDEDVLLINPSFEGTPRRGAMYFNLEGWNDCGKIFFSRETPPDVHPAHAWENEAMPSDGRTYVGMVVRDNDSWESITQRLQQPIEAGKCYEFSIELMRSPRYVSATRLNENVMDNYQEPAVLRMWGGTGFCNQRELLAESSPVTERDWTSYSFQFKPQYNHRYFTIEVFYKTPVLFPYNGHILIDNASHIRRVLCPGEEPTEVVAAAEPEENKPVVPPHLRKPKKEPVDDIAINEEPQPKPTGPKIMEELDRKTIKKGQIIKIKNLYFDADKSNIDGRSEMVLNEIYYFLKENPDISIEIGGHTNGICQEDFCDKLSKERARTVAEYLIRRGIKSNRLEYKGYGKRKLIANDKTPFGREKNQRVEIKILDIASTG